MLNPLSWHIEPTSRCTLECPGCDRTWFKKTFKKQIINDIDIDDLINFFHVNKFYNSFISLCGNNGDPIYHPEFKTLIKKLKEQNHILEIHTNGSAKTKKFWIEICDILTKQDTIIFAIDGLKNSNSQYRINSNWQQIMDAVEVANKSVARTVWKFIVFNHNQTQIKECQTQSQTLGFDEFCLVKSHRWLDESLQDFLPNEDYIDKQKIDIMHDIDSNQPLQLFPQCNTNKMIYIDCNGDIYPCCWTGTYRFKEKNIFGKEKININQGKLAFNHKHQKFLKNAKEWNTAPLVCRLHCAKN